MRYNADIRQSQNNKGDLGYGATEITAAAGLQNWTADGIADLSISERNYTNFTAANVPEFLANSTFKNAFVQKIFSVKKEEISSTGRYLYSTFYNPADNLPMVEMHELPTMGQITDYLLKPSSEWNTLGLTGFFPGGVMAKYVGDHFNTDGDLDMFNFWDDYNPVVSALAWSQSSLSRKLKLFLDQIINTSTSLSGFPIHASTFYGGSQVVGSQVADNATYNDLWAGSDDQTSGRAIFEVVGNTVSDWKWIKLLHNSDSSGIKPVGIVGQFESGDAITDFTPTGSYFTFIDVSRYYLRTTGNLHTIASGSFPGLRWMNMGANGWPTWNFDTAKVYLREPHSTNSLLVQTNPNSSYTHILYKGASNYTHEYQTNSENCFIFTRSGSGEISSFAISDTDYYPFFSRGTSSGSTDICKMKLQKTADYSADYHFLLSEATESIYGNIGTYMAFLSFRDSANINGWAALCMHKIDSNNYRFYVNQKNGSSTYRNIETPSVGASCDFLVTDPSSPQEILNTLDLTNGGNTIRINPTNTQILNPSGSMFIEGIEFSGTDVSNAVLDSPDVVGGTFQGDIDAGNAEIADPVFTDPVIFGKSSGAKAPLIQHSGFPNAGTVAPWNAYYSPQSFTMSRYSASIPRYIVSPGSEYVSEICSSTQLNDTLLHSNSARVMVRIHGCYHIGAIVNRFKFNGVVENPQTTRYTFIRPERTPDGTASKTWEEVSFSNTSYVPASGSIGAYVWFYITQGKFVLQNKTAAALDNFYVHIELTPFGN